MTMKDSRRDKAKIDIARADPASLYDKEYYSNGCDLDGYAEYGRHEPWLSFFRNAARTIVRKYAPRTAVDVGCAYGLLVEALNDEGVDTYGYDISPFAISNARPDMRDRLKVHSILDPIPLRNGRKYDIAICIEVLEHLPPEQADRALDSLCAASDLILFSSSPDDFDEPTHFNVLPTNVWLEHFQKRGFAPIRKHQATFIAPHAFVVARGGRSGSLARRLKSVFR
jgi:2-polyprenyl-3-methyl-5-hydroxy-6-metoxy-1,4-benzoquinol methylase